MPTLIDMAEKS